MSRSLNKVMLIGNLGADPEVRGAETGSRVARRAIARCRVWNTQAGERQEKTEGHRVVLWNNRAQQLADVAEKYLKRGDRVYIDGRIDYRTWEDREGKTRYTTEIVARELIMLTPRGGEPEVEPAKAAAAKPATREGGSESYEDFPEALNEEDDDLPF